MMPERGRGVKLGVVLVLAVLAAAATLTVVAQRSSDPMALDEASALALATGDESPAKREEIASGGTFIAELRRSLDVARNARQRIGGTSMRVATGRDQLQQMSAEQRSADEASAAETLQHYVAQEAAMNTQPVGRQTASGDDDADEDAQIKDLQMQLNKLEEEERKKKMGARRSTAGPSSSHRHQQPKMRARRGRQQPQMRGHAKWDGMRDSRQDETNTVRQQARKEPAPQVRVAHPAEKSQLASRVPPPVSQAFTVGMDKDGHLDEKSVRAFLQSNGDPQKAQRALAQEEAHVGDEEVTWGDDNVDADRAHTHLVNSGIRDLFKGVSGLSGW